MSPQSAEVFRCLAEHLKGSRVVEGLHSADAALVFAALHRQPGSRLLWISLNNREAEKVARNLSLFLPNHGGGEVLVIPGAEADPYRGLSPHPEIAARRSVGLWKLLRGYGGAVVTTVASMATRLPSAAAFLANCLHLEVGGFVPLDHLLIKLREAGYLDQDPVGAVGEYSSRGGIVDIFSPARDYPVRVELFGDEIESIREFDPSTQRSVGLIPSCEVVPMREMVVTEREIAGWHDRAPRYWSKVHYAEALQEKLQFTENGELFNGFEFVLPLVHDKEHSLLEFVSAPDHLAIVLQNSEELIGEFQRLYTTRQERFEAQDANGELVLPPQRLFFSKMQAKNLLDEKKVFYAEALTDQPEARKFNFRVERKYQGRVREILEDLGKWRSAQERVVFVVGSRGMAERLVHIFKDYEVEVQLAGEGIDQALSHPVAVVEGDLSEGFHSALLGLHVLTEADVFGEAESKPSARKPASREITGKFLSDFRDLKEGDYVVHVEHGIGVFRGLKHVAVGQETSEFVVLSYRDEARLYVPTDRLDLIQKYSGTGGARPQINKLGGVSWERTKRQIKKSMRHLAEDLLKLYALREMALGHAFAEDDALSHEFEEAFEFEETPDQAAAIRDVRQDMLSSAPMDRLICGDVGYGKTEVAMRAAFRAVKDGRQVAVLAPTTVLAYQHLNTFRERFRGFPVNIKMLSRFQSRKEQKEILQRVSVGLEDIVIGTHRLLSRDVSVPKLGLIIVDEEQRFGVSQKEKLKSLKTEVDVIALSATPIPRTLNMSLIGLRDLSLIETPPQDRLAIQTVVVKFSRNTIRSAIDLELKRQGQIFLVHNSIETIDSIGNMVRETVPEARVAVAHGRMKERDLEQVMLDFLTYKYDVLVSTTIIENGLDIPRANTLIVNRADRFGLGQLYQLRGRVGRSNRRAYAYFLIPTEESLSPEARQRLAAIKEFSQLGSGFRIAALDLEIRGAGNLLGGEQHGHINAVGFELYTKLLEQAVQELRGEEVHEEIQTSIDLRMNIQIPEHYVDDSNWRLWLYKRVSSVAEEASLTNLREEIVDRFGKYPSSVANLLEYARLRLRAQQLRIMSLEKKNSKLFLRFREDTPVSRQHIIELVERHGHLALNPDGVMVAEIFSSPSKDVFEDVHGLLDQVTVLE